jgi:arylsulfatase
LQDLFWAQAADYDVLPLQWDTAERLGGFGPYARPSLNRGRNSFTYFPGMTRMQYNVAPDTYNRSFRITAEVDIPEKGAEGALIALGGVEGGWSFTVEDGTLVFHYNWIMSNQ